MCHMMELVDGSGKATGRNVLVSSFQDMVEEMYTHLCSHPSAKMSINKNQFKYSTGYDLTAEIVVFKRCSPFCLFRTLNVLKKDYNVHTETIFRKKKAWRIKSDIPNESVHSLSLTDGTMWTTADITE